MSKILTIEYVEKKNEEHSHSKINEINKKIHEKYFDELLNILKKIIRVWSGL